MRGGCPAALWDTGLSRHWHEPRLLFLGNRDKSSSHLQERGQGQDISGCVCVAPWMPRDPAVLPSRGSASAHPLTREPGSLGVLPPILPSIRVFSNESTLRMRWPKYWSFSFSIVLPMNTQG